MTRRMLVMIALAVAGCSGNPTAPSQPATSGSTAFVVSGTIAGSDGRPVADATVEIESSTGTVLSATTNAGGAFAISGVAGAVQLKLSAAGYQSRTVSMSITRDTTTFLILTPLIVEREASTLTVTGPERFAEYGSAQYRATLGYADGSSQDVTNLVTWSINFVIGNFMTISNDGLARGQGRGRSMVRATLGKLMHELVVNAGPGWIVTGAITDAQNGQYLAGATWVVVSGTAYNGFWDDFSGTYSLYGAEGHVRLQVSHPSYVTRTIDVNVTGDLIQNVTLTPVGSEFPVPGSGSKF